MMKFQYIILLIISVSVASCNPGGTVNNNSGTRDTISYTYKNFKQRDSDCGNSPDSSCTVVKIKYPDFDGRKTLNDSVARKFVKLFALTNSKPDTDMQQLAENFIAGYRDFKKEQPLSTLFYLLDGHAKVVRQDPAILTVAISGYSYHGGPHGVEYTSYVNWNTKANKSIGLSDIFINGYKDSLNRIGEQIFRNNEKLKDTASLNNGRTYFFAANKFSLPDNYLITPAGICFLYNVYTIKAYAAGKTELLIPYAQIKSLLLPDAIVKQYMK